jgi:hypothetical protein
LIGRRACLGGCARRRRLQRNQAPERTPNPASRAANAAMRATSVPPACLALPTLSADGAAAWALARIVAGTENAALAGCRFLASAEAGECATGDVGAAIGAGSGCGWELGAGLGVRLRTGAGLLVGAGVGARLRVRVGVGDAEAVREVCDGVGLGVGEVCDGVGLGVGEVGAGLGLGDGLTDPAATATGKQATVPATSSAAMITRRINATRRRLAAADPGRRTLVLEILASPVTVGLHFFPNRLKQAKGNNAL